MMADTKQSSTAAATVLKGGRVVDPMHGRDGFFDVRIENGVVSGIEKDLSTDGATVVDVPSDFVVCPGSDRHACPLAASRGKSTKRRSRPASQQRWPADSLGLPACRTRPP